MISVIHGSMFHGVQMANQEIVAVGREHTKVLARTFHADNGIGLLAAYSIPWPASFTAWGVRFRFGLDQRGSHDVIVLSSGF